MPVPTIEWKNGVIRIIDQTKLPGETVFLDIRDVESLAEAICSLRVRGAPAIGIAGAMGAALAARNASGEEGPVLVRRVEEAIDLLAATRPTAVNLFWALDRMRGILEQVRDEPPERIQKDLEAGALTILEEDRIICRRMGRHGANLLPEKVTILTHCNAGGLATADYGTALGVVYAAVEMGKKVRVFADETRPLLQGSRLTAWELMRSGIDVTVICDSMAGFLMQRNEVDCVLVGADRIAANGDVANKIGTYSLAVLADRHRVPFYVVAPLSTFDFALADAEAIPIEERSRDEVIRGFGRLTGPEEAGVYNPAFDRTPCSLVSAFVTEEGVIRPPYSSTLKKLQNGVD